MGLRQIRLCAAKDGQLNVVWQQSTPLGEGGQKVQLISVDEETRRISSRSNEVTSVYAVLSSNVPRTGM